MTQDYRATVFLPATGFAMKADLAKREPEILRRWAEEDLFSRLRRDAKGREKFILHDGPPYANGHLHIGHALNKILKDVINRTQQMLGKDANYVPGWDCHGLPIEWEVERRYRAEGKDKDAVPLAQFRAECRAFAEHWITVQKDEFKRLGVLGDWDHPYTTMSPAAEAQIVREVSTFALNGGLFRGARPVLWSPVERTALAEAEVEYHDHKSTTVHARFPVAEASHPVLAGAAVVIWTTTPWTLPGNRAVAYGPDFAYVVIEVAEVKEGSLARVGERLALLGSLVAEVAARAGITGHRVVAELKGADLAGTRCRHPLHGHGYDLEAPLLPADFVEQEAGTGFVHIAPGHGAEDFALGQKFALPVPETVGPDGCYLASVPCFAGQNVYKVDPLIAEALGAAGTLLARGTLVHSYPHSWRSKAPLIFRTTPQWFISMATNGLRRIALAEIDRVRWVPAAGRNRIHAMIAERPDWVISRQRAWGVPITVFTHKATGALLKDPAVQARIVAAVSAEGTDTWFTSPPERFLGNDYPAADYAKATDILDVWFESGSTHSFVLEGNPDLAWPASLYLEGVDQHRGWFHSSLLEACGTRGRAPYQAVLTHGFVLDGEGRKMSKSLGNVIAPQEVTERHGADILRLWVASADYSDDLRISNDILKHQADGYRRFRNTLRYLLGNLAGFGAAERLARDEMPELDRWVLHRLTELDAQGRQAAANFTFHAFYNQLHNFCALDLSAFYFDVRKDALYCDSSNAIRRRAARTVLDELFSFLTAWLAPVLCFTAEEAWRHRLGEAAPSVHLRQMPNPPAAWADAALGARWARIRDLRRVVTGAIEVERQAKRIGASLQAHPTVYAPAESLADLAGLDLAEILITSDGTLLAGAVPEGAYTVPEVPGIGVVVGLAAGEKCGRCWRVLPEVGGDLAHPALCGRCVGAVAAAGGVPAQAQAT
ncbi:MAG: isoleucine--tRNA ligase [Alphaproteobacteria bacterium]|nr:isoleucine--tRNA ligase [Alphaproteobacteria bacterium]